MRETPTDPDMLARWLPELEPDADIEIAIPEPVHTEWTVRVTTHRLPGGAEMTTNTRVLRVYYGRTTPQ